MCWLEPVRSGYNRDSMVSSDRGSSGRGKSWDANLGQSGVGCLSLESEPQIHSSSLFLGWINGTQACVSVLAPEAPAGGPSVKEQKAAGEEECGKKGAEVTLQPLETHGEVKWSIHSTQWGRRTKEAQVHAPWHLCEEPAPFILKRVHNSFDSFERRMGKKLISLWCSYQE